MGADPDADVEAREPDGHPRGVGRGRDGVSVRLWPELRQGTSLVRGSGEKLLGWKQPMPGSSLHPESRSWDPEQQHRVLGKDCPGV